jgi:hypothetical protein
LEHINNKNILVKEQFGFRSKLSTEATIYSLVSEISIALNKKKTYFEVHLVNSLRLSAALITVTDVKIKVLWLNMLILFIN